MSDQFASLVGHQNSRQKIRYVKKIRDENTALKMVHTILSRIPVLDPFSGLITCTVHNDVIHVNVLLVITFFPFTLTGDK